MANNWNKMPLFEYDIKVNMEDNMASALMHLFNVVEELQGNAQMSDGCYLELVSQVAHTKQQKWFMKTTDPVLYHTTYVLPEWERRKNMAPSIKKYCKFCNRHVVDIREHREREIHKRCVIAYRNVAGVNDTPGKMKLNTNTEKCMVVDRYLAYKVKKQKHYKKSMKKIVKCQSWIRGWLDRMEYEIMLENS